MKMEVKGANECITKAIHVYEIPCCKPGTFGAELYEPLSNIGAPTDALVTKTGYWSFWETGALQTGQTVTGWSSRMSIEMKQS